MTDDIRVHALRAAVGELLDGYSEVARLLPELAPDVRDPLLAPLRRAADSAAAALSTAS
ncbi:MAG TPA: hypothetical protein VNA20_16615 [Frankiaceae bacterium]|nr:hypothetical protein [Frankiaceae bacterium]